jgi:hypothetical protein
MWRKLMKHVTKLSILILSLTFVFAIFDCGKKEESKPDSAQQVATSSQKPTGGVYESKSGIITYGMNFMGEQTQVLYFDDWGKKEARYSTTEIEMMGVKSKTEEVEINSDGYTIKFDLQKKQGTKMKSFAPLGAAKGFPKDLDNLTKEIMDQYKMKDLGKKDILGKQARAFEMDVMGMKSEVWIWNNIPVYTKVFLTKDSAPMEITAVKIETDVPIPADKFQVPSDIKLTEIQ